MTVGARTTSIILNTMLLLVLTCPTRAVLTNKGIGKCPHTVKQRRLFPYVVAGYVIKRYGQKQAAFPACCYFHLAMNSLVRSVLSVPGFVMF